MTKEEQIALEVFTRFVNNYNCNYNCNYIKCRDGVNENILTLDGMVEFKDKEEQALFESWMESVKTEQNNDN